MRRKTFEPWTLLEVGRKYGKDKADWIREKIKDGTINPMLHIDGRGYFTVRLKNSGPITVALDSKVLEIHEWVLA